MVSLPNMFPANCNSFVPGLFAASSRRLTHTAIPVTLCARRTICSFNGTTHNLHVQQLASGTSPKISYLQPWKGTSNVIPTDGSRSRYAIGQVVGATRKFAIGKFIRNKPHLNIGTIGHIDHGKTTLSAAITKVVADEGRCKFKSYEEIDRSPEEKKRGITINATKVEYETESRHYGHVDCPGHADYVKNMVTGANQMDGAILVVSAVDGPMPQTKEHIILAKQIGVPKVIVYLNKLDSCADLEMADLVELEVQEMLTQFGFDGDSVPFIRGSARLALQGDMSEYGVPSIKKLLQACDESFPEPKRSMDLPFLLPIEDVYSISGKGTVVTGRVECGVAKAGSSIEVIGYKDQVLKGTIGALETYHKILSEAIPGDEVGILLKGNLKKEQLGRGMVVCAANSMKPVKSFEAEAYVLTPEEGGRSKPFNSGFMSQAFIRTSTTTGAISLLDDRVQALPGDTIKFRFDMLSHSAVNERLRFAMREGGKTIAAAIVTKLC